MVKVEKIKVGELGANCYILHKKSSNEAIIIDPGDDAEVIVNRLRDLELNPTQIVATHAHFDHVMAVNELKLKFNIPFLLHQNDELILKWMRKSAIYFTKADPGPKPIVDHFVDNKSVIDIAGADIRIIETPGHSPGGICLYLEKENIIFSGDTIFANGSRGRTDFPYCDEEALFNSINKVLSLPGETKILPGHGEPTTVLKEREFYQS